jgi:enoyl-CoA hydratase/carnithine racemase
VRVSIVTGAGGRAFPTGLDLPLDDGIRLEAGLSTLIAQTEDAREGPKAFAEKQSAVWQGR